MQQRCSPVIITVSYSNNPDCSVQSIQNVLGPVRQCVAIHSIRLESDKLIRTLQYLLAQNLRNADLLLMRGKHLANTVPAG